MRGSMELAKIDTSIAAANKTGTALIPNTYGKNDCSCVGIDYIVGTTTATLSDGSKVSYPADVGARCQAWDMAVHPKCDKQTIPEPWCGKQWCYVDPSKCAASGLPRPSVYIAGAKYQGKPIHYSYTTCGAQDSYTAKEAADIKVSVEAARAATVDAKDW